MTDRNKRTRNARIIANLLEVPKENVPTLMRDWARAELEAWQARHIQDKIKRALDGL